MVRNRGRNTRSIQRGAIKRSELDLETGGTNPLHPDRFSFVFHFLVDDLLPP